MIDCADARREPVDWWGEAAEFRVEDDEGGAHARLEESVFVLGAVVGATGEGKVFAAGEGCRDAN